MVAFSPSSKLLRSRIEHFFLNIIHNFNCRTKPKYTEMHNLYNPSKFSTLASKKKKAYMYFENSKISKGSK